MKAKVKGIEVEGTVDEIRELLLGSKAKKKTTSKEDAPNNFKQWSAQEDKYICENCICDGSKTQKYHVYRAVSKYLGRTHKSVQQRFYQLKGDKK